jgi:hypothetical protein
LVFLRSAANHFQAQANDIFVTPDTIKKEFPSKAAWFEGPTQASAFAAASPQLKEVERIRSIASFCRLYRSTRFEN